MISNKPNVFILVDSPHLPRHIAGAWKMSEYINNVTRRKEILKSVLQQLHNGKSVDEVKAEFGVLAKEAGSAEIAEIEQMLIEDGIPAEEIQNLCDVHVAVFQEGLDQFLQPQTTPGHPVDTMLAENRILQATLDELRRLLEAYQNGQDQNALKTFSSQLEKLKEFDCHYRRKEQILFPYLEKVGFFGPSTVMWGIQDEIRLHQKQLMAIVTNPAEGALDALAEAFELVDTEMRSMIYKEEKILFPASLERLKEEEWTAIRNQEHEIGYFFVVPNPRWTHNQEPISIDTDHSQSVPTGNSISIQQDLPLDTGYLPLELIDLLLRHLPLDVTFVDEKDTVRYFSQTKERIFERPPAIIGRRVQNCHPPQSLGRVQRILDDFREGIRDQAEFWIQMGDRFVHILYIAVFDEQKTYRGVLEVTQDITHIRNLQGERRLLDE
jgi:uncharacterized protein